MEGTTESNILWTARKRITSKEDWEVNCTIHGYLLSKQGYCVYCTKNKDYS